MLNVSTALPTLPTRGTPAPAPAGIAGGDFQDALDGLITAPAADAAFVVPMTKVEIPALASAPPAAPATSAKAAPPVDIVAAVPLVATVIDPALLIAPVAPPPTAEPNPATALLPAMPIGRQAIADDGKIVPAEESDDDPGKDVLWLPTMVPPAPAPVARSLAPPEIGTTIAPSVRASSVPVQGIATSATSTPGPVEIARSPAAAPPTQARAQSSEAIAQPPPSPNSPPAPAEVTVDSGTLAAPARDTSIIRLPQSPKPELAVRADTVAAASSQTAPPQPLAQQPSPILPAGQVFAAAIAAVVQQGRDDREQNENRTPLAIATAALDRTHTPAVTAPADARQTALDLRQDSGLQDMIDHIEVLRDGANAGDTRMRLVPDALGAVEVSVRRDGDRLHVHFNAENQASARLIADAQPRLAELAEARGVKLGQTSVDSGEGQSRQHQPAVPVQFTRPAAATDTDTIQTLDDLRVA